MERHTAQVAQVLYRLSRREPVRDLNDVALAHAVDEEVGLAIQQDRPPDRVAPVVVMREPAQAGLDTARNDRHTGERLPAAMTIGQGGAVGAQANPAAG